MKLIAENLRVEPSLSGGAKVSFETLDLKYSPEMLHKYDDKKVTVEIKEKRGGRSLDANAYCWVLCDKIAQTKGLMVKKVDVYKQAIRDYGVTSILAVENDRLQTILKTWDGQGIGNSHDILGRSQMNNNYTNVRLYVGSSQYDSYEMSVLIDGIVAEAQDLGIDTMTPAEIEKLKSLWGA